MMRSWLRLVWLFLVLFSEAAAEDGARKSVLRLVSLAPSVTETIFALGAGEQLVGICSFCDFPSEAEHIPRMGAYATPNIEAILAAAPDLVIGVPPNNPEAITALRRADVKVIVVQIDTSAQIEAAIRTIAAEIGRAAQGEHLLADMRTRMAVLEARLADAPLRRVLMVVGQSPLIAVGSNIYLDELITRARGVNIAAVTNQPWPQLSLEFAVAKQPEVIIDGAMGSEEKVPEQRFGLWKNFPELPAVRDRRLYGGRSFVLLRPGPRLPEAFEEIARYIHPERFP